MKGFFSISVVLFWCYMNFLLVRHQLQAPPPPIRLKNVADITEPIEEWWGVYFRGEKIGYSNQKITPADHGYRVQNSSLLRLSLLGTTQEVKSRLEMAADSDWALKEFEFDLASSDVRFQARGKVAAKKLELEIESGGHRTRKELSLVQRPYLLAALKPYIASQNLEPGKEQLFPTFDPATLSQQIATVTVEGREKIKVGGKLEPALRIRQAFKGISVTSWLDGQGRTLKEESGTGLALIRERPEEATALARTTRLPLDLIAQASIPVDRPIANPEERKLLRLRLSGFDLSRFPLHSGRQRLSGDILEIRKEELKPDRSYRLPLKEPGLAFYTQSSPFLQSDHPQIRAVVQSVLQGETDALKAATRIRKWVYEGLAKVPTVSIPNALEVLRTKRGDCNEHTVLFNAMARSAGIPAKTVVGLVYLRGAFYYHAWSEIWLGDWISLDSVLNQFPADVTHIKFLEGEIDRQIDIIQLIGKLKIEVLEAD